MANNNNNINRIEYSFIVGIKQLWKMITAEDSATCINVMLDKYNLSKEEFWKDPEKFLDNIEDKIVRIMIEAAMQLH